MQALEHSSEPEFWSAASCGRQIAIFHHYHVLQHNVMFASSQHAMRRSGRAGKTQLRKNSTVRW